MTSLPIVVDDDSTTVAGFVSDIDVSIDVGAPGRRGSIIFTGTGDPPEEPPEGNPIFEGVNAFVINDMYIDTSTGSWPLWQYQDDPGGALWVELLEINPASSGSSITPPGSSTDNAIVIWDGTGGDTVQDSGVTVDGSGNVTVPGTVNGGEIELGSGGPTITTGTAVPSASEPQGSIYIRDGSLGDHQYVATSDAGAWAPTGACDTGVRDLSGETLSNGWTVQSSTFNLRRIGNTVYLRAMINGASASDGTVYTLPAGFRPDADGVYAMVGEGSSGGAKLITIASSGVFLVNGYGASIYYINVVFDVVGAWPTSLPGA